MSEFDVHDTEEFFKFGHLSENVYEVQNVSEQFAMSDNSMLVSLGHSFFVRGEVHLNDVEHNLTVSGSIVFHCSIFIPFCS